MVFDPKVYRDNRSGIGMPADEIATDTSSDWTAISLLKSIANKLGVGAAFSPSTDVAQNSTTAGQTGGLTQAAVTTAAPTYTTGKTNPLSLKTTGELRVADAAAEASLASMDTQLATLLDQTNGVEGPLALLDDVVLADDAAFVPGTSKVSMVGFEFDDAAPDSVDEGDAGAARMSANRNQYVQLRDGAGNERGAAVDSSNRLNATIAAAADAIAKAEDAASASGDVGVPAMGIQRLSPADTAVDGDYVMLQLSGGRLFTTTIVTAATTSIGKAEDAASADADVGVPAMAVQKATPANTAGADGDYEFLQMSAGRLWVSSTVTNVVPGTSGTSLGKAEDGASADGDTGVGMLAVRKATPANTSGTDGDYEFVQMANGRLWVRGIVTDANDAPFLSAANALNSTGAGVMSVQLVGQFDDVAPTAITENQFGNLRMSTNRNLFATLRDAAGNERGLNINANNAASVAVDQTTSGTTNGVVPHATAATGGIVSTSRIVSAAATTNGTSAKASAGRLYGAKGYNAASSVRYLKIYNKASAPTVGSDTPIMTLALPPLTGFAFDWPVGYSFATGIAYALTTGSADADTGALTAGDVVGLNVDYA